jgi:hypothetical protein
VGIVTTTLVFCAGRNRRYAEIALAHGFAYGCRSDYRPLFPVAFADLNWRPTGSGTWPSCGNTGPPWP